jgi:FSR family fosmidomycin resistance protein-like MFS transporter
MSIFSDKKFSSVALGHFTVDILNGQRSMLLVFFSNLLGLNNTMVGVINAIYMVVQSIAQPLCGYLTDRVGVRWMAAGGVFWMSGFLALSLALVGWPGLVLLIIASIGSGIFHPAGALQASLSGRDKMAGREATATSIFFLFGQLGFFAGPLVGGLLKDAFNLQAIIGLCLAGLLVGFYTLLAFKTPQTVQKSTRPVTAVPARLSVSAWGLAALFVVAASQSWGQQNMYIFLPKYLASMGLPASVYGLSASLFMGGAAFGNLLGGSLADRIGKRPVIAAGLLLSSLPVFLCAFVGASPWLYPLVVLGGALNGAAYTVIVVFAQRSLPGGEGLASGLALGIIFASGALGTILTGLWVDAAGYLTFFYLTAGLAILGGLAGLTLGEKHPA